MTAIHDVDSGEQCPICGEGRDDCSEHLLGNFGVTEPDVGGGALFDCMTQIEEALLNALASNVTETLPQFDEALPSIQCKVIDGMNPEDAYREEFGKVIEALRAYFDDLSNVYSGEYGSDSAVGTWEYANYWTENPRAVVDELIDKLMDKTKAPTQNSESPLPRNYRKPIADISPESWKALLEQSTKDEIAAGDRARSKGKMLIEAMSPEERKRLGLPGPTQSGTENTR